MAIYLSNRNGNGQTDEEGHYRFTSSMWGGDVIDGVNVTQNSPLGMSVLIQPGDFKIDTAAGYAYQGWVDTADEVTISAANPSNPRLDRIVLYVDLNETTAASPANNPGIIKSMAVAGTPAAVPVAPNNAAVNSAVGSGNPWIEVARVLVNSSVTQITDGNITDFREFVTAPVNSVDTSQIKDGAVTPEKRSGGIKVGTFTSSSSTGNQSITGVGFKPKCVKFVWLLPTSPNANYADGVMSEDGDQYARTILATSVATITISVTDRCFITPSGTGTTREASFVSMDADGFTINWNLASTATPIGYTAYA